MVNGEVVKFKFTGVVLDHYRYMWGVVNHNVLRNDGGNGSYLFVDSMGNILVDQLSF